MPKVKPLIRPDPTEEEVLGLIGSIMATMHLSRAELAIRAKMNPRTFNRRMQNPKKFRASELSAIMEVKKRG